MLIAVDTGGTKTLVAGFNSDGEIIKSEKFPTSKNQSKYLEQLTGSIKNILGNKETADAIVVALPGIIKEGVAIWCNNLKWSNFDVATPLKKAFPGIDVLVENDANLAGLAETRTLDPMPVSSLYVTISTGIGTGMITNGKIDPGLRNSEGGHALVEYDGIVRQWETFASGQAIYKTYGKYARDIHSKRAWEHIADRISRGFIAVIPIIQPDIIIIGGSIGTYFERYSKLLNDILIERLPPHIVTPKIIAASHPEEAVIYGCYYYALDNLVS